jgi:hypothetical protein
MKLWKVNYNFTGAKQVEPHTDLLNGRRVIRMYDDMTFHKFIIQYYNYIVLKILLKGNALQALPVLPSLLIL